MDYIGAFYQNPPEQSLQCNFPYLNAKSMQLYVDVTVQTVLLAMNVLKSEIPNRESILDVLPKLEMFAAPLGD